MIDYYTDFRSRRIEIEETLEWQTDNLEYDLRTSEYLIQKVRNSRDYAQNLYSAMCNNEFQRNDVIPILTDKLWGCSMRYAGGILADMKGEGDYMDYYCSGIGHDSESAEEYKNHVSESVVTDEVRKDLFLLGWIVKDDNNSTIF